MPSRRMWMAGGIVVAAAAGLLIWTSGHRSTAVPIGPGTTAPYGSSAALPPGKPVRILTGFGLEILAEGLDQPVDVAVPPGGDDIYVVEKTGRIWIISGGEVLPEPFLDVSDQVETSGLEQGLLDLAFHPGYASNGRFFVHLIDLGGDTRIYEYRSSADPHRADADSRSLVMGVEQPHEYHNGGMLQFGPDGYLYAALGDGGGIGDPFGNGQRADTVFGTIVRLDVDAAHPYAVPPDNPFLGGQGAPEVWAYGLRNPWRFWIDPAEQYVYIADVGQETWEEVDVVPLVEGGHNFGWPVREGPECFQAGPCDVGFTDPVFDYPHEGTCSIIGGPVYRGEAIPELWGHFIYGDFCAGWIRSFRFDGEAAVDRSLLSAELSSVGHIQSFGVDAAGEVLVLTAEGSVFRLMPLRED
ncbi:MAG: PQQ-dependent sugar dehydrogenase [Acidimicrobiia bacterium]